MLRSSSSLQPQNTSVLRIRLVDKKVFKKFNLFLGKPVKEARTTIAKELGVDADQYGLFVPPKDEQAGKWCKDDYPLSFYGYEGEKDSKEALLMSTGAAALEYIEFKKRFRPIRILVSSGTTIATRAVTVDDTKLVAEVLKEIFEQIGKSGVIGETELFDMHEDEYELLTNDMTIREQGFLGECTMGLYKRGDVDEMGLYVKVPFAEGWLMRKRGGGVLKGLKNWNKRWYVLKKNKIMYFKSKAGSGHEPMGVIPIKNIVQIKQTQVTDVPSKYEQFCFEIVTPARTFVMLALSEHEFCSWMTHLDTARRMFAHETIFLSPLQSGDQPSPTMTPAPAPVIINKKKEGLMVRGEQQRRMTLVILSEDDPHNIHHSPGLNNMADKQRSQMLKRVNTSPAISAQQRMAASHLQKGGSPRSLSPSHSPRSVSPARSPRSASPAHSPTSSPKHSPRSQSPVSSSPSSISSLASSTISSSVSSAASSVSSTSAIAAASTTPPATVSALSDTSSIASSPNLSSSPSGPSSASSVQSFLVSTTPPPDDEPLLAVSSNLEESEIEELKLSSGSPSIEEEKVTVFVGEPLFSDGASIERIGDEWLGPSFIGEVDMREDFLDKSKSGEFALVKSASYMEDLAGTARFSPHISSSPLSSVSISPFPSPYLSSISPSPSLLAFPSPLVSPNISPSPSLTSISSLSSLSGEPGALISDPTVKETEEKVEVQEQKQEEPKEEPKPTPKEEPKEEPKEDLKEKPKEEIKEETKEPPKDEVVVPQIEIVEPIAKTDQVVKPAEALKPTEEVKPSEDVISTAAKATPAKPESPHRPSSPAPTPLPRPSPEHMQKLVQQPSPLRLTPVQQLSVNNSPRQNVSNNNLSSRSPRPAVPTLPEEEITEEDVEFIKANEDLKYLFYEPRSAKTRGDMLRAWANYIMQKGGHTLVNDWLAAHKDLQVYLQLLHHHDSDTVPSQLIKDLAGNDNNNSSLRASALEKALSDLGIDGFSAEAVLKGDHKTQRDLLQAIYEGVGAESMNDFYYDVISRRNAACRFINSTMKDDPNVTGVVPFHPLYSLKVVSDGSILCHLINKVYPGTIDTNLITLVKRVLHPSGVPRLILLSLNAAISLGADALKGLDALDWADPNKKVRMLNELMWGVVEVCGLKPARPRYNPQLAPLQRVNEDSESFLSLSPSLVLVRWINHHLRKNSMRTINNLSDDLEDGENYVILLEAIAPGSVPRKQQLLNEQDWESRASAILRAAKLLGCRMLITPKDLCEAENVKVGPLFIAELLRVKNGFTTLELSQSGTATSAKSNKEVLAEAAFSDIQPWLESLELGDETNDVDVSETFKDGTIFLKILDAIAPGAVDPKWLKVDPKGSRFKMIELANKTLEIATSLKINTTNIGGVDLVNGDIRPTVSLLNHFSRYGKAEGKSPVVSSRRAHSTSIPVSIVWANNLVQAQGKQGKLIMSFKDQLLRDGRFLLDLISSLYPKVVTASSVTPGQTEEEQEQNARYLLSLLWSLGIPVSVLWQDIVLVRSQAIKHLLETLHNHYEEKTKGKN